MRYYNKSQKLTVQDLVTIAILSVLCLVLRYLVAMAGIPFVKVFMIFSGAAYLFLSAPLYLVMANRVGKRGVFVIYASLLGIADGLMGYLFLVPYFFLAGMACELIMLGQDTYKNAFRNTLGWISFSLFFSFGNYIAVWFAWDAYQRQAGENGLTRELLNSHHYYYTSPLWICIISGIAVAGGLLGSLFGHKLLTRHFKKSGLV